MDRFKIKSILKQLQKHGYDIVGIIPCSDVLYSGDILYLKFKFNEGFLYASCQSHHEHGADIVDSLIASIKEAHDTYNDAQKSPKQLNDFIDEQITYKYDYDYGAYYLYKFEMKQQFLKSLFLKYHKPVDFVNNVDNIDLFPLDLAAYI